MTPRLRRRLALGLVLLLGCVPAVAGRQQPEIKTAGYKGKVVPRAGVLDKQGVKLDADAAEHWLALVTEDGKVYPLVKDDGSRMFFKDKSLLNRPMLLTARLVSQPQMLQVVKVQSYVKGELRDVFYWCDICSIRTYEPGPCSCCGAPLDLHEDPPK